MHSNQSVFSVSKTSIFLFSIFMMICSMVPTTDLQATGWGKSQDVFEYEGTKWNGVYLNLDGLNAVATIPNYSAGLLQNMIVAIEGRVENFGYVIKTSYNRGFNVPNSLKEFVQMIQEANPGYLVNAIEANMYGAKYAVDLIPTNPEYTAFWRFFSTNDRLLMMGTDDINENRRISFFGSLYLE